MDARWQALRAEEEVLGESEGGHKSTAVMPNAMVIPALGRLRQGITSSKPAQATEEDVSQKENNKRTML